ncbi:hypothetical protein V6Z11_A04G062500 [Gossypium hirsutum]
MYNFLGNDNIARNLSSNHETHLILSKKDGKICLNRLAMIFCDNLIQDIAKTYWPKMGERSRIPNLQYENQECVINRTDANLIRKNITNPRINIRSDHIPLTLVKKSVKTIRARSF